MSSTWSAYQYLKFEDHRTRPAIDLLSRVAVDNPGLVTDLGCGPGNSTELLADRFKPTIVAALDSSETMIEAARKRLPQCKFELADIADWQPEEPQDVIFANAVLQWVPHHHALFPRLLSLLKPGGVLAVQMPDNLGEPTHASMRTVAADKRWVETLADADAERTSILDVSDYWSILKPYASFVEIWRTTYVHPLAGLDGIIEWFKGTGLLPYLSRLNKDQQAEYLSAYRRELAEHYPLMNDGVVLLPFPRPFIVARR